MSTRAVLDQHEAADREADHDRQHGKHLGIACKGEEGDVELVLSRMRFRVPFQLADKLFEALFGHRAR